MATVLASRWLQAAEPSAQFHILLCNAFNERVKCFYSSKHVRGFFKIIVWSIWLISICLTCIIANDNAKLHTIQKKYVLLREFARLNQEWADKADYIEFLYTDEAEHQKDIERLWENRHKRLAK